MVGTFDEYNRYFDGLTFAGKLDEVRRMELASAKLLVENRVSLVSFDGYLRALVTKAVQECAGNYCVYLWKHAWGEPFYVGSGTGNRWKSKSSRCDDFYLHIDAADAVVYKIIDGVDRNTARLYECYVSASLSAAGYVLANSDNNIAKSSDSEKERIISKCSLVEGSDLTKAVENAVFEVINHNPRCDHRITSAFLEKYGTDHFSRTNANN